MSVGPALLDALDSGKHPVVHDPLWGHVHFPESFIPILESSAFVKLASIRQLGPSWLAFPGATHTRYNHSIGVYHIASRYIRSILGHGGEAYFTKDGVLAFLAAALCHDLGHFPYTHSLKELPLLDHEVLTAHIVQNPDPAQGVGAMLAQGGIDPARVAAIIDHTLPTQDPEVRMFRQFLSGVLDPDKLDYLPRDAHFCGLPYGAQDTDHVLHNLRFLPGLGPAVSPEGVRGIEHLLFSKYLMYRTAYWNPRVRMATGMVKKAVRASLEQGEVLPQQLYGLTDSAFESLYARLTLPEARLVAQVSQGNLYQPLLELRMADYPALDSALIDLSTRHRFETQIAHGLSELLKTPVSVSQVLIDVPERISFEVHMPVVSPSGKVLDYPESDTVFNPAVVQGFTASLRHARLALDPALASGIPAHTPLVEYFLEWCTP